MTTCASVASGKAFINVLFDCPRLGVFRGELRRKVGDTFNSMSTLLGGPGEALSSLRKWYTVYVHRKIYIVVVGCISFRREVSVNELHTHTYCITPYLCDGFSQAIACVVQRRDIPSFYVN